MKQRDLRRGVGWIAGGVAAVALGLGVMFAVVRGELVEQVGALDDNATFMVGQTEVDLLRIVVIAQLYAAGEPDVGIDEVRERIDILFSRLDTLTKGEVHAFLSPLPEYGTTTAAIRAFLDETDALLADEQPSRQAARTVAYEGQELQTQVHDLVLTAIHRVGTSRDAARRSALRLVEYLAGGFAFLMVIVVGGSFLVYRIFRSTTTQRLSDLTQSIPGAVFQLREQEDGRAAYLFANRAFAEVRGVDPQDRGADDDALLPLVVAEDQAPLRATVQALGHERDAIDVEFRIDHPARGRRWLNLRAAGRRDDGLVISGVYLDVTERKAQEEALAEAKAQAEAATQAKSSFLAMMSHEIRTPMNGVMTMAEMLDQTELSDDQRGMTAIIRSSSAALLTIINDILDFSKIEAGKLDVEAIPFDLVEIVEEVGELLAQRAEDKGIDLVIDLDPALPERMVGDPVRVRQVLLNLAGNALKFTEHGSVAVLVRPLQGGGTIRAEIRDTGVGLTPEQRSRLFQPFQQADGSTSRRFGGTGLGLSISRRLCEMMGGAIGCESEAGVGSTFWFELPAPAPDGPPAAPAPSIGDAAVAVLGVRPVHRAALANALAAAAIADVAWLEPGEDALRAYAAARPPAGPAATVLLFADGSTAPAVALAARLASDPAFAAVRFVLAGPRSLASTLDSATRRGVFATLALPLRRSRLRRVIAAALGRAELDRTAARADAAFAPPEVETARRAGVLTLVAEDNATNRVVIGRLLDRLGYAHEMAEDGRQALALWRERPGYGLLLTDFHMPEMDGFELTRAIRAEETASGRGRLPIVAVTADALPGTRQLCLDTGMDDHLTKPIEQAALRAALERHLPDAAALRRAAEAVRGAASKPRAPAPPAAPEIDPEIFEMDRFLETFGRMDAEAERFLRSFLGSLPGTLGALDAAMQARDLGAARHVAHALKGSAYSVGAKRLGMLAGDVQDALDGGDADTAELLVSLLDPTREELVAALEPALTPQPAAT